MNQIEYVDPKKLKVNPYRKALGIQPIDGFEKTILEKSIREYGIMVDRGGPIKTNEDMIILDGHDRTAIAISLGIQIVPVKIQRGLTEDEQKIFVIEENLNRKHLPIQTRAMMAVEYYKLENKKRQGCQSLSEKLVAKNFGVGEVSLRNAKTIIESKNISDSLKNHVRAAELGIEPVAYLDKEDPETIKAVTEIVEEQLKEGQHPSILNIVNMVKQEKTTREHEENKPQSIKDHEPTVVEIWLRDNLFDPCTTIRRANTTAWFNKLDIDQSDTLMANLEATIQVMKDYQTQLKHIPIVRSGDMEAVSVLYHIPIEVNGEIVKKEK